MNPILQALNNGSPLMNRLSQARQVAQTIKSASNPQAMLNQMMDNNPQVKQLIEQYGDPKTAFYKYAESSGINPDDVLQLLK